MKIEKFDYLWRIALIVVLVLGFIWVVYEFQKIDKAGVECLKRGPCPISLAQQYEDTERLIDEFNIKMDELEVET
jgi:hypothetical protein